MTIGSASIALSDLDVTVAVAAAKTRKVCVATRFTGCEIDTVPHMLVLMAAARPFKPSGVCDVKSIAARGAAPLQLISS